MLFLRHLLYQAVTPPPQTPTPTPASFWDAKGNDLLAGLLLALASVLFGVLIAKPLEALLKWLWKKLQAAFEAAGFGFEKRYLKALANQHQWLKLIGIYSETEKVQPRLQNVFVSLRLSGDTENDGPRFAWERLFAGQEKHLVILGQPGTGKSTLLDYLLLIFTGRLAHPLRKRLGAPLPVYARLRDLGAPGRPQALLDLLQAPVGLELEGAPPRGFFEKRLRRGHCVALLDGLDEVLDPKLQREAVHKILRFANTYPDNWIIVTCRVAGWHNQLPNFRPYEVQDFDGDDIQRFVGNWYREVLCAQAVRKLEPGASAQEKMRVEQHTLPQAQQAAGRLWQALDEKPDLLRIASTPLILSLITLVHKNRRDLPQGRAKLYSECLEVLLETWDKKDKDLDIPNNLPLKGKLLVLQTISLHFLTHGLLEMDAAGLEKLAQPLLPRLVQPGEKLPTATELIRQIYERSGVLDEKALGRFGFAHRALADYLAALAVTEAGLDDLLLAHAAEERWREVILIASWLAPERRRDVLIEALAGQGGEVAVGAASAASLALAGWSLAEGAPVGERVRRQVEERLLAGLNAAQGASELGLLSGAMLAANPAAASDWMCAALTGRDARLRQRTLALLPELPPEASLPFAPRLAGLIGAPHEPPALRAAAALALARLNFGAQAPDASVWAALQTARQPENPDDLKAASTWAWCELGRYASLGLVKAPAGEFWLGSDPAKDREAYDNEQPQGRLYLPTFYISRAPATTAEWRAYCQASEHQPQYNNSLQGPDDHPARYITWGESLAYARYFGYGLPSEAEWEKAARGGLDLPASDDGGGRIYPWGDVWQPRRANTQEYWQASAGDQARRLFRRKQDSQTTPVGKFSPLGDSPYGCVDMSGNVWEWTRSLFQPYPYEPGDGRENLADENSPRVLRGGSFLSGSRHARCSARRGDAPNYWGGNLGFRVGVSAPIHL